MISMSLPSYQPAQDVG